MSELGDKLRELRVAAGLSQRDLAKDVGVGFPHISKLENGVETPSDDLLLKLAGRLAADVDELMLLAQRVPPDLAETVIERDVARMLLRRLRDGSITDDDLSRWMDKR